MKLNDKLSPLKLIIIALTLCCLPLFGCAKEEPVPPEVKLVEAQEISLWRTGAHLYMPDQYARYKIDLNQAKEHLIKVSSRMRWFRNYEPVRIEFTQLLNQGNELLKGLENEKQLKALSILGRINNLRERIQTLAALHLMANEQKALRNNLAKAEVILNEAQALYGEQLYITSEEKLGDAEDFTAIAEKVIAPVLIRYNDKAQIANWRKWANETINESRGKGIYSILVIKAERKMILYHKGKISKTYRVGLGRNGLSKKQHSRDYATPEGKYQVIKKNPRSRYYKALLINYPNEEDRKEFLKAKKRGLLSGPTVAGSLIEIHGGSSEGMTYGCISMDNSDMEELYHTVEIGTPVTIIGTMDEHNSLSSALTAIKNTHGQKKTP